MALQNIIIEGKLSATSKKQNPEYPTDKPRKTLYITPTDESLKKCEEFGLQIYKPEDKKEKPFIIVKASEKISVFAPDVPTPLDTISGKADDETKNFKTNDDRTVSFSIIKGEEKRNIFYRVSAILAKNTDDIVYIEQENPFMM